MMPALDGPSYRMPLASIYRRPHGAAEADGTACSMIEMQDSSVHGASKADPEA
jgi:hypothetical protein